MNIGITPDKVFPGADGTPNAVAGYQHALDSTPALERGSAGHDLDRRRRPDRRPPRPAARDRRAVLLRHVVGHRELADDLRVLARRRDPGLEFLAPDQPADPDANELDLAGRGGRVHPRPAVPVQPSGLRGGHVDRGHRPVRGLHRARLPAACVPGRSSRKARGRSAAGAGRSASWRRSGSCSSRSCSCSRRLNRSTSARSTTRRSCSCSSSAGRPWWVVSAKNWFKGPKVQGTPEELAAIERDLELAGG